jgi:hypothetical protein
VVAFASDTDWRYGMKDKAEAMKAAPSETALLRKTWRTKPLIGRLSAPLYPGCIPTIAKRRELFSSL